MATDPGGPTETTLTIGPVVFRADELMGTELPLGTIEGRISTQEMIGGGRQLDFHGAQPGDTLSFSGTIWYGNVQTRITQLQVLAAQGTTVLITYLWEAWYGKVKAIRPKYRHANRCNYTLELVIENDANGIMSLVSPPSMDQQVNALMSGAQSQVNAITAVDPPAPDVMQMLQNEMDSTLGPTGLSTLTSGGTPPSSASVQQTFKTLNAAVNTAGPLAQITASGRANLVTLAGAATQSAAGYTATLGPTAPQYVAARQLTTSLSLVQSNIAQGQAVKSVQAIGGDLMAVSALHYGTPDYASELQSYNGLPSIFLPAAVATSIALPPFAKSNTTKQSPAMTVGAQTPVSLSGVPFQNG